MAVGLVGGGVFHSAKLKGCADVCHLSSLGSKAGPISLALVMSEKEQVGMVILTWPHS